MYLFHRKFMQKALLVALLSLIFFIPATAQKIWTLEDCVQYALDHNLDIKKQLLTVESYKKQVLQSKLNLLPDLNANATNVWNFGQTIDMFTNTFANTTVQSNNFYLSSNFTLFNGLTKLNTIRENQYTLDAIRFDLDVLKDNTSLNVAQFYLTMLLNTELLENARQQVKITQDQVGRVKKMVEAGSSAKGDLLNIQAQQAAEEYTVVDAENKLNIAGLSLQLLIDLPVTKDFTIEKPVLNPPETTKQLLNPEQVYNIAVENRPEIKSADLRVQAAEKSLAIARGLLYPSLTVSGSWGTGYSGASKEIDPNVQPVILSGPAGTVTVHDTNYTVYSSYTKNSYRTKSFTNQLHDNNNQSIGFYLRIPLFNGWQTRTSISQAKIKEDAAQVDLDISKRELRKSIELAYADAVAALKKYNSSQQKVTAQEESFKYTQQKFDVGMLTSFDYNTAKKDLSTAQSELLQSKYDFIFRTTIIDFYMGKPIAIK